MNDERPADGEAEADATPGSVFGNLPESRPGTRSPRRNSAAKGARAAKPKPASKRAPDPATPRAAAPPPAAKPGTRTDRESDDGGGLEDLAWAGVAAAAEAATLGVRLASRAIEALRGNSER